MGQTRDLEPKALILPETKDDLPNLVGVLPRMVRSLGSLAPARPITNPY